MWISNTATAAMLSALGLSLLKFMEVRRRHVENVRHVFVLMTAYGANYGGVGTPIGTPPNLITMGMIQRYAGIQISFVQWMFIGVPIAVAIMGLVVFLYSMKVGKDFGQRDTRRGRTHHGAQGTHWARWKRGEKNVMIAFGVTVIPVDRPGIAAVISRRHSSDNNDSGDADSRIHRGAGRGRSCCL